MKIDKSPVYQHLKQKNIKINGAIVLSKYYAIKKGRHPGIYTTWDDAKQQVDGFSGAVYKSFKQRSDAETFMDGVDPTAGQPKQGRHTHTNTPVHAVADQIVGYTDGGSRNTGNVTGGHVKDTDKAAWAYRLELPDGRIVADSAGEWGATNNRMEIMALIRALAKLQELNKTDADIHMVLDSQYVLNAITKHWISGWKRRGWKRSAGDLANAELWQELDGLLNRFSNLSYAWTKGHATNDGNLFVDDLLNKSMDEMKAGHALKPSHESVVKGQKPIVPAKPVVPTRKSTSQKAASKPQPEKPLSNDVKKSVSDIEKALGQLDMFKDL